jgi:hypothetical protein
VQIIQETPMHAIHALVVRAAVLVALTLPARASQEPPKDATTPPQPAAKQEPQPDAKQAPQPAAKPEAKQDAQPGEPPPAAPPQATAGTSFSKEQLEQIAAPIALYPDKLLSHLLMAATYPLEVVEAARWRQKNPSLEGKALEEALKAFDWDPSVKSLCGFTDVLKRMNENLDWTQDLGDAFLGQKKELFDAVQALRAKALEAGQLKTTEQQKVTQEDKIIVIESSNPEVIYVPTYSPTVVYGPSWGYPYYYYPPMYAPPPPGYGFVSFGFGMIVGGAIWGDCDWNDCDVDIDIDHHNEFTKNVDRDAAKNRIENRDGNRANNNRAGVNDRAAGNNRATGTRETSKFNHDPAHRKGVNYKNPQTAQRFGGSGSGTRVTRDQARGYDRGATPSNRPAAGTGAANRPSAGTRPSTTNRSTGAASRPSTTNRSTGSTSRASGSRGSALSGSRSPSLDRASSTRGATSRASSGARSSGARGGGARGGGGRGGGGRR